MIEESNLFDRDIDGGSLECEDCPGGSAEDWNGLEAIPAQEGRREGSMRVAVQLGLIHSILHYRGNIVQLTKCYSNSLS